MAPLQHFPVHKKHGQCTSSVLNRQYFAANKIENADQQRAILLSVCGPATYRLIRNLVSPKKPTEFKIDELIDIVRKHHDPKPSAIVQRFRFNSRNRHTGESIAAYVAQLRQLAEHCEYGTTLNDMLRDRLVCGVDDLRIQRHLLAEPQLTFDKAFEIAMASESAEKNVKDLQSGAQLSDSPVNKLSTHHSAVVYHTRISYRTRMVRPYAYGMAICTICVYLYYTITVYKQRIYSYN